MARSIRTPQVVLLVLGFTLLVTAWIGATTPFGAPDEASHFDRAVGVSRGTLLGKKVNYGPDPALTPTQQAFINHDTRAIEVPAKLKPFDVSCIGNEPAVKGCLIATPNGNFPPLGYALPAVAIRASNDVTTAMWLTRAASALQSIGFLVLAVALLWGQSGWSLVGLLVAVSPMVLYVFSIMNTSGIEIASCLAFAAAVLRLARSPARAPRWVWVGLALSGAVGLLTGPIGLAFVLADVVLFVALIGPRNLRDLSGSRELRVSGAILLLAAAASFIYSRSAGFSDRVGVSPILTSLHGGLEQLGPVLKDAVGHFGSLTVALPVAAVLIWWLLVILLIACASWLSSGRDRLTLGGVCALALAFPVLFWAWVDRYTGFGLQGREVLPPIMLIPLFAGELVFRNRSSIPHERQARFAFGAIAVVVAVFQAYAWWVSARAAAGAPGTLRFYAHARWSPPLGWWPWIAAAALGTLALLAFAAIEVLRPPTELESTPLLRGRVTAAASRA